MPSFTILLKKSAEKDLENLPDQIHDRVIERLLKLETQPRPAGIKKLRGKEGYRLRIGNYRVLYTIDDSSKVIEIYSVAHRKDVYRR